MRLRRSIILSIFGLAMAVSAYVKDPTGDMRSNAILFLMLFGFGAYAYGAHLADEHEAKRPERFSGFLRNSNVPIFSALFRAAQAGDPIAAWSLVLICCAPFLLAAIILVL